MTMSTTICFTITVCWLQYLQCFYETIEVHPIEQYILELILSPMHDET